MRAREAWGEHPTEQKRRAINPNLQICGVFAFTAFEHTGWAAGGNGGGTAAGAEAARGTAGIVGCLAGGSYAEVEEALEDGGGEAQGDIARIFGVSEEGG